MYEYLQDLDFLSKLDKMKLRTQYARIILLSFNEKPIREIQGVIASGTINVNSSSAIRRTLNLSMVIENDTNIENIDNLISINKKIKVEIGYKNPLNKYDDIIWFPCGLYVLTDENLSYSTSGCTLSISARDKMVLLDGSVGGTIPASVTFHEKYIENDDGTITIEQPTIYQIIQELVYHYGKENANNIFINGLSSDGMYLLKYIGEEPIYISNDYNKISTNLIVASQWTDGYITYQNQDDVGYEFTSLTYPGELVVGAGESVASVLQKICNTLGNYEFFYDLDGHFIFQEIENYLNTTTDLLAIAEEDYIKNYTNTKYLYSLTDNEGNFSITQNPKYSDIKNDFIVWGRHKNDNNLETNICYHLAIDEKPIITIANQYMWEVKENNTIIRYELSYNNVHTNDNYTYTLIGKPCDEWREELYRQALIASFNDTFYSDYDAELLAFWRMNYDTMQWDNGWNPDVIKHPESLIYWLDFIDSNASITQYSVNNIGRRTKVVNDSKVKVIFNRKASEIAFIANNPAAFEYLYDLYDLTGNDKEQAVKNYFNAMGQKYCLLNSVFEDMFTVSSTTTSAYDIVRDLLYQHLCYNTTISITCLPKYYYEPNNIIYIQDAKSGINGNYVITQFSLPLDYAGSMSITMTEMLTRV